MTCREVSYAAVYSASAEEVAIVGWSEDDQAIRAPAKKIRLPVVLLALLGSWPE